MPGPIASREAEGVPGPIAGQEAGVPSPIAGREAGSTGVCGSTGRTPDAAWVGETGVLGTLGGEGIGRVAFARRRTSWGPVRGPILLAPSLSSLLEDEEEDFFFLELEDEEESLPPPSLLLDAPREEDEDLLELFRFPEPQAGLECSPKGDLSKPEALPRDIPKSPGVSYLGGKS